MLILMMLPWLSFSRSSAQGDDFQTRVSGLSFMRCLK